MIKEIKEIIILISKNPIVLTILVGLLFILSSIFKYDKITGFCFPVTLTDLTRWLLFIMGVMLVGCGVIQILKQNKWVKEKINIKNEPLPLTFGKYKVNIKIGKIEDISGLDKTVAVVLPVDATFIDELVDTKTAFGSFNITYCPDRISELKQFIKGQLQEREVDCQRNNNEIYPVGTIIELSSFYNLNVNILLIASVLKAESIGFKTEPSSICKCVEQIFEKTAIMRISKLIMPILGSGRGGISISTAVLLLLISINYCFTKFHHGPLKEIDIVVHEKDEAEIPEYVKHLQYAIVPLGEIKK
ncbi:MAG: macro domain-containing protein [bacterium]